MARRSKADLGQDVMMAIRVYLEEASNLEQIVADLSGVGRTEMRCVGLLDRHGGRLTAGRLAELTRLTTGAITGVIDRLERAGLARRVADPRDRRRVIVELDPTAHAKADETYQPLVLAQRAELERMTIAELEAVHRFLVRAGEHTAHRAATLEATDLTAEALPAE